MSESEIQKAASKNVPVLQEIEKSASKYASQKSRKLNTDWDASF